MNPKAAQALADPSEYENLFPDLKPSQEAESYLKGERAVLRPAADYPNVQVCVWGG